MTGSRDRRLKNRDTPADRTDANLNERVTDFQGLLKKYIYYRIPLGFFVSLGLVNFAHKIDTRILFPLETNLNKLFEANAKLAGIPDNPDAQVVYHDTPYISYPQITLHDNFIAYYNGILRSRCALRTGVILISQSSEINTGTQSLNVNFRGLNKQIEWLEISLVYDKSDQHQTIYESYDVVLAVKFTHALTLENASTTYSLIGQLEYKISNEDDKNRLYEMFVAYYCDGCSMAPLTQYKNNKTKQGLTKEKEYFSSKSDGRFNIDMKRSKGYTDELKKLTRDDGRVNLSINLKAAATKKMRLWVNAYSQSKYWHANTNKGHIMMCKDYIAKNDAIAA